MIKILQMKATIFFSILVILFASGCRKEKLSDEDKNKLYDQWKWIETITPTGSIITPITAGHSLHFTFTGTDAYTVLYDELQVEKGHFKPGKAGSNQELILKFKAAHFLKSGDSEYFLCDENFVFHSQDTLYIFDLGGDENKRVLVRE
jgi:hypothetical protein